MPQPSITCPKCKMVSYHPQDISHKYCGNCHAFHDNMVERFGGEPDGSADAELFDNSFHEWLEAHGVQLGEWVGDRFLCPAMNLNDLKLGMLKLIEYKQNHDA